MRLCLGLVPRYQGRYKVQAGTLLTNQDHAGYKSTPTLSEHRNINTLLHVYPFVPICNIYEILKDDELNGYL